MLETKRGPVGVGEGRMLLNAMLDAEADEITGACRRSYTLECKTNAARRALEGEPPRPRGARRGLHADERVPVDAPLPGGDTGD